MCKRRSIFVATLLVAAFGGGCSRSDPTKHDEAAIQGTWVLVAAEQGGQDVTKQCQDEGFRITFRSDAWIQDVKDYKVWTAKSSHFALDATKLPAAIDHIVTRGAIGEELQLIYPGIYQIDGDTLKLWFDVDIKERPTDFSTKPDKRFFSATLKRIDASDK
jgi:uncharacterized protein (TIGR03067 family)